MKINSCLLSTGNNEWGTPKKLFDELDEEFHFTLDPCASDHNHKCDKYYTKEQNGLKQSWAGETVFCNPPYGREKGTKGIDEWIIKAYEEGKNTTVVMLIPSRTDKPVFHDYIFGKAEARFIRGRIRFEDSEGPEGPAPFPSVIVIYRPGTYV